MNFLMCTAVTRIAMHLPCLELVAGNATVSEIGLGMGVRHRNYLGDALLESSLVSRLAGASLEGYPV